MENEPSQLVSTGERQDTTDKPLVSIITPVLNCSTYLEACIESVLNQSYPYIEHIFIDGGSSDGTLDMLSSYQARYPDRIRFISDPVLNKGAAEAWNKGWEIAKGKILGWLGSDDMSEPGAIETVVEFFKANPHAYFVFGECNFIDENGNLIVRAVIKDFDLDEVINNAHYIACPSAFYKREVVQRVGLLDTRETGSELDYWIRVGKVFPMHRIEKVLSNFRMHQDSVSGAPGADKMYAREGFIVSRRYGGSLFSPRARRHYKYVITDFFRPVLGFAYPFIAKVLSALGMW